MVSARVAQFFSPSAADASSSTRSSLRQDGDAQEIQESTDEAEIEDVRAPYPHVTLAGGLGGLTGDMLMHSLDTVKTRQQGDPYRPPKYNTIGASYWQILREEGVTRGLYGGVTPAFVGSFLGTCIFFASYEWSKRLMIDHGVSPTIAYFSAGLVADIYAAPLYVPTEVLKTRLQLQGRYNNPHFVSGYNYRSTWDATRTIIRKEGVQALFYGYRATLARDLPFSALQFAFYEKERELAKHWVGSKDIGLPLEILTGATAGGMAGTITCPLDVVKTRIQTQIRTAPGPSSSVAPSSSSTTGPSTRSPVTSETSPSKRHISTSGPSTATPPKPGSAKLDGSSVLPALRVIYRTEGIGGWFRGVGPRAVWTSVQSGAMFVLYQALLKYFETHPFASTSDG